MLIYFDNIHSLIFVLFKIGFNAFDEIKEKQKHL